MSTSMSKLSTPAYLCGAFALLLGACSDPGKTATAALESRSASTVTATATFTQDGDKVTLTLSATGLTAGPHAVHLHETGDCSAADATSAGAHWNPTQMSHGNAAGGAHHAGDIGNLTGQADGKGTLTFSTSEWTIGTGTGTDVVGHAVIIHEKVDDFTSQPAGNAGARQACGVVKLQ